jgi:O-antigen biosynthesis protein
MTTISVVISMYNRRQEVLEVIEKLLLPSLLSNGRSYMELVVLDDCSSLKKATEAVIIKSLPDLKKIFGNVIFSRNKSNLGFARSYNRGIDMAGGKIIIVGNDDLYFPLHSIERLARALKSPKQYLIAGPITNASGTASFQYCRQAPLIQSYAPEKLVKLERFSSWLHKKMRGRRMTTDNLCGFCFAADADLLKELGGFDERFGYGFFEDTDLIQRIARQYGQERIAIDLGVFVGHGGTQGASRTMVQQPLKAQWALIANGIKYARRWGYRKLLERMAIIVLSQFGKGTISELLPKKIDY